MTKNNLVLILLAIGYAIQTYALIEIGWLIHAAMLIVLGVGSGFIGAYYVIYFAFHGAELEVK